MTKRLTLLKVLILSLIFLHEAHAQSGPPFCRLSFSWRTADLYQAPDVSSPIPHAIAASGNTVFAAGSERNSGVRGWVVRRSLNRGATWSSVDFYARADLGAGSAGGIAIDPRNNHIYVAGAFQEDRDSPGAWVVRKSEDNGASFITVDEIEGHYARKIAVDFQGYIYVVGRWATGGGFLRRSTDEGKTWQTVNYTTRAVQGYSVITSPDGRVFVGTVDGQNGWRIYSSADGLNGWEEVDYVPGSLTGRGGRPGDAHITEKGDVLFTGVTSKFGGTVRTANFKQFKKWKNLFVSKEGNLIASTSNRRDVYVTGILPKADTPNEAYYTTWRLKRNGSFVISDRFLKSSQTFADDIDHIQGGATTTGRGDILTTQFFSPLPGGTYPGNWIVRRKFCLF